MGAAVDDSTAAKNEVQSLVEEVVELKMSMEKMKDTHSSELEELKKTVERQSATV